MDGGTPEPSLPPAWASPSVLPTTTVCLLAGCIPARLGAATRAHIHPAAAAVGVAADGIDTLAAATDLVPVGTGLGARGIPAEAGAEDAHLIIATGVSALPAVVVRPPEVLARVVAVGEACGLASDTRPEGAGGGAGALPAFDVTRPAVVAVPREVHAFIPTLREVHGQTGVDAYPLVADGGVAAAHVATGATVGRVFEQVLARVGVARPRTRSAAALTVITDLAISADNRCPAAIPLVAGGAGAPLRSPPPGIGAAHGSALALQRAVRLYAHAARADPARAGVSLRPAVGRIHAQVRAAYGPETPG